MARFPRVGITRVRQQACREIECRPTQKHQKKIIAVKRAIVLHVLLSEPVFSNTAGARGISEGGCALVC